MDKNKIERIKQEARKIFKAEEDAIVYLYGRWLDEREYEDFKEYAEAMKKLLPEGYVFESASKRPFGMTVKLPSGFHVRLSVNSTQYSYKVTA